MNEYKNNTPLISVIIPTYNYARFISRAIESVLNQTYKNFEIIVVDDGSGDDTREIVKNFSMVIYLYQHNKGISAARNTGIKKSTGDYLIFLDADDWLEEHALEQNFNFIQENPGAAFISGNYYFLNAEAGTCLPVCASVKDNHYVQLLQSNYIGMLATVLFQRWVFDKFSYDENLKACEDYDLYLHIARKHPVAHHDKFIATYFFHNSGLSHNYKAMMDSITVVIQKQQSLLRTNEEIAAYNKGLQQWKDYQYLLEQNALPSAKIV